jgi:glutamate-1-semialdehyde 2,1-aminomutase
MVECAEKFVSITPWADWVYFAKNGSDATAIAVRVARSATGKRVILRATHAYHGSAALWAEGPSAGLQKQGVLTEDVQFLAPFTFNDLASVQASMDAAGDDVAGVIVSAFMWDYATPHTAATATFLRGVRKLCDDRGALLICDDVRSSFRIDPAGTWADPRYVRRANQLQQPLGLL